MMEQNNDSRPTINGALAFRTDSDADFLSEDACAHLVSPDAL